MEITKEFQFDSAHNLLNYNGKCANLHGHTYKLFITIKDKVNENGFVMDFVDLKKAVKPIIEQLDHHYLNDIIEQPTCENTIRYIKAELDKTSLKNKISKIRLYETPTSYAEETYITC